MSIFSHRSENIIENLYFLIMFLSYQASKSLNPLMINVQTFYLT